MKSSSLKGLNKLAAQLFSSTIDQNRFIDSFLTAKTNPQSDSKALIWTKNPPTDATLLLNPLTPLTDELSSLWQGCLVWRVAEDSTPGKLALHEEGYYYCANLSSILCASILTEVKPNDHSKELNVIDLCASPGGKSIFASQLLKPTILVAHEIEQKRVSALISNLKRCEINNVFVTTGKLSKLTEYFEATADVIIADAPCSGQSLILKGLENFSAFHSVTINRNVLRQRSVLANAATLTTAAGYIAYMTCTFSIEENEKMISWFLKKFPTFSAIKVDALANYRSELADFPCYRFFPFDNIGAGGFSCLLKNNEQKEDNSIKDFPYIWQGQGEGKKDETGNSNR